MATFPFSCHQHFIWCKVDDKLSFIKYYVSHVSAGQQTVVLVKDKATIQNTIAFLLGVTFQYCTIIVVIWEIKGE